MSAVKKFVPVLERFPEHYKRFLQELQKTPSPVHYKPPTEKYVQDPETKEIKRVEDRPVPVLYPKECQEGIWGGEGILFGYRRRKHGRYIKYFTPNIRRSVVYSEILDKYMRVTLTERTLLLINKNFGFDNYILKTPVQDLKSQLALDLRRKMLLALARKDLYHDNQEKQKEMLEKYKEFIIPEKEAEWFGLTLERAEKKLLMEEEKVESVPLKYQFLKDYLAELECKLLFS
ncbi:unnamed protein product [Ixodes hexagonus]